MKYVSRVAAEEGFLTIKGVLYPSPRKRWPSPCSELIMPWKKIPKGGGGYGSEVKKNTLVLFPTLTCISSVLSKRNNTLTISGCHLLIVDKSDILPKKKKGTLCQCVSDSNNRM